MPDITQGQINLYDLNQDQQLTQADVDFAIAIGMHSIAGTIASILATGTGELNVIQAGAEMESEEYQTYLANPQTILAQFNAGLVEHFFSNPIFQSVVSASPAAGTVKTVIDWTTFGVKIMYQYWGMMQ